MKKYLNRNGNSPVTHYHIGDDHIIVRFNDEVNYTYTHSGKAGEIHVENMKTLAISGGGLSAYIAKYVKKDYDRKD